MQAADEEFSPITGRWSALLGRWDEASLAAVTVSIVGMVVFLLWPQPQAQMTLSALTPSKITSVINIPGLETNAAGSLAEETKAGILEQPEGKPKPRKSYRRAAKKPAKPPITSLNGANAAQLQLLPGIGPKMATRIIEYRKQHGAFASVEQVMEVSGIGPKKFEKMRPYLKI